ncbi:NAD(P)-dependent alcohol dehydrogenase [Saccharicrinis sp. FJH54]|uniref:NAD(P)-dependent alcohol dehydrogenase n=1 Tax=Saccharicrinis sp. FJH54 TaxID=3344665 RepID=UPI0035D49637
MKAVVYNQYGPPNVLKLTMIDKPVPKSNELLVKIYATSVTAGDWRLRKADPVLARLYNGLLRPRRVKILGFELSGIVEAVGNKVSTFKTGDEVFASCGIKFGAYSEYKCFKEKELITRKPQNLTFEEAATVPIGCLSALKFLEKAKLKSDQSVLIYGASGSVGTYAIQLVKYFGSTVTAVCSTNNTDLVKSLGADKVVDYTKTDFTAGDDRYDIVFDAVGKTSKTKCNPIIKPGGQYISVRGSARHTRQDIERLRDIIETGKVKPVIDRVYHLEDIREAHAYVEQFRKRGNVAVTVADDIE